MKAIIVRRIFIAYLVTAALPIGGEAAASVIYRLAGTVVEADEAALPTSATTSLGSSNFATERSTCHPL